MQPASRAPDHFVLSRQHFGAISSLIDKSIADDQIVA
jgi:hypothetical protein